MMAETDVRKLTNEELMIRICESMSGDDDYDDYVEPEEGSMTDVRLLEEFARRTFDSLK